MVLEPEYPPSAVKFTVNFTRVAVAGQLNVTVPVADAVGTTVPRFTGVPEVTVTGPVPATLVIAVMLVMVVLVAAPTPVFVRVANVYHLEAL